MTSNHGGSGDPDYDWMEVLDNFLGSDDYEHNENPDRNDTESQVNVQHQIDVSWRNENSGKSDDEYRLDVQSHIDKRNPLESQKVVTTSLSSQSCVDGNFHDESKFTDGQGGTNNITVETTDDVSARNLATPNTLIGCQTEQIRTISSTFTQQIDESKTLRDAILGTSESSTFSTGRTNFTVGTNRVCTLNTNEPYTRGSSTYGNSREHENDTDSPAVFENPVSDSRQILHQNDQGQVPDSSFNSSDNSCNQIPRQTPFGNATSFTNGTVGCASAFTKFGVDKCNSSKNLTNGNFGSQAQNGVYFKPIQKDTSEGSETTVSYSRNPTFPTQTSENSPDKTQLVENSCTPGTTCFSNSDTDTLEKPSQTHFNIGPKLVDSVERSTTNDTTENTVQNDHRNLSQADCTGTSTEKPGTLEKAKTLETDEQAKTCSTENTQDHQNNQNSTATPVYYQPIYFAPIPFYGFYWGNSNQSNSSETSTSKLDSDNKDKIIDVDKDSTEKIEKTGTGSEEIISKHNGIEESTKQSDTSSKTTDNTSTGTSTCADASDLSSHNSEINKPVVIDNGPSSNYSQTSNEVNHSTVKCTDTCSTDKSDSTVSTSTSTTCSTETKNLNPSITYPTIAKIPAREKLKQVNPACKTSTVPKLKKSRTRYTELPLVPSLESTKIPPVSTKPLSSFSQLSVPCPILIPMSDVSAESSPSEKEASSTRAMQTDMTTENQEDRDETCQASGSTMSGDNDSIIKLELPEGDNESKALARSERKRNREKQRRTDVNAQFAALTSLLRRVEAEDLESDADTEDDDDDSADPDNKSKKRKKCSLSVIGALGQGSPSNRVDLIARTITVMDRLHELSAKRRTEVRKLKKQLKTTKPTDEVAVADKVTSIPVQVPSAAGAQMMPMASPSMMMNPGGKDGQQPFMMMVPMMMGPDGQPQGAMPGGSMPLPMQFMGPQCYPMQPPPQGQQVKMPPQGMQMMPPGMYPGQPPQAAPRSPGPMQGQMMPLYGGGVPGMPRMMSPHQGGPPPPRPPTPSSSGRSQQKKNVGGDLAHCA